MKVALVNFVTILLVLLAPKLVLAQVMPQALSAATIERLDRVPEFTYIRELAQKYGIKVYLFGGTAAAFGHYVRWDLEREAGDDKYQSERFDYDFTNIYRGNQDLDIVLDTDAETAKKFQLELQTKFPHFQGNRNAWEVRLLRSGHYGKSPLLNDYDFLNQHTDSNSTGLIDVSQLDPTQQAYFDLRDWENLNSKFLTDVASGTITYYHTSTHETTARYKSGMNPPILSAVRYLAKLTQYDVVGRPEDLARVKAIIAQADFAQLSGYSREKLAQFSLKALLNSPDVEYAWNLLDGVGLRQKLIEWDKSQVNIEGSLAWWMNKEPLRSFPLGQGNGKTAQELGLDVVSHATKDFQAYENITRSAQGRANVFISRNNITGEGAGVGEGFYTMRGSTGGKNTGITIRFRLHPNAKIGKDFSTADSIVVVHNKNAIQTSQEKISLTLPQFLKLILSQSIQTEVDKGLIFKIERRLARMHPTPEDINASEQLLNGLPSINTQLAFKEAWTTFEIWLSQPVSKQKPKAFEEFIRKIGESGAQDYLQKIAEFVVHDSYWSSQPRIIVAILERAKLPDGELERKLLERVNWRLHQNLLEQLIRSSSVSTRVSFAIAQLVLSKPDWTDRADLVAELIKRAKDYIPNATIGWAVAGSILTKFEWSQHPELLDQLLAKDDSYADQIIARSVLTEPFWAEKPQYSGWVQTIIKRIVSTQGRISDELLSQLTLGALSSPYLVKNPDWVVEIATYLFTQKNEEIGEETGHFREDRSGQRYFREMLRHDIWTKNPILVSYLAGKSVTIKNIIQRNQQLPFHHWLEEHRQFFSHTTEMENCAAVLEGT